MESLREHVAEKLRGVAQTYRDRPIELVVMDLQENYPRISLQDAQRVKEKLLALFTATAEAQPKEVQDRLVKEYKDLQRELGKKYRKSGK